MVVVTAVWVAGRNARRVLANGCRVGTCKIREAGGGVVMHTKIRSRLFAIQVAVDAWTYERHSCGLGTAVLWLHDPHRPAP